MAPTNETPSVVGCIHKEYTMNKKVFKENQGVVAQYAQALRIIREKIGEAPTRDLELTGRLNPKDLGNLVDVVNRHHEILSSLEDSEFFCCKRNPTQSRHQFQAVTPVGTFLFGMDFSKDRLSRNYF